MSLAVPNLEIEGLYKTYLRERKSNDLSQIRRLRGEIAIILAQCLDSRRWYQTRLKSRGYGFGDSYQDVALSSENKYFPTSLAESWIATENRIGLLKLIAEYLENFPEFITGFAGGSIAWRQFFNYELRDFSDLDLTIVLEKYNPDLNFDSTAISRMIAEAMKAKANGDIDMFKFKVPLADIEVSVHVWTMEEFDRVKTTDYCQLQQPLSFLCLRDDQSKKAGRAYGPQHNFAGDSYYLPTDQKPYGNTEFFTSRQHIIDIGEYRELILGEALDSLLFNPLILGGDLHLASDFLQTARMRLAQRIEIDKNRMPGRNLSFANLPSRKDKMPPAFLSLIKQWDTHD